MEHTEGLEEMRVRDAEPDVDETHLHQLLPYSSPSEQQQQQQHSSSSHLTGHMSVEHTEVLDNPISEELRVLEADSADDVIEIGKFMEKYRAPGQSREPCPANGGSANSTSPFPPPQSSPPPAPPLTDRGYENVDRAPQGILKRGRKPESKQNPKQIK